MRASGRFVIEVDLLDSPMWTPTTTSPVVLPVMTFDQWIAQRLHQIKKSVYLYDQVISS